MRNGMVLVQNFNIWTPSRATATQCTRELSMKLVEVGPNPHSCVKIATLSLGQKHYSTYYQKGDGFLHINTLDRHISSSLPQRIPAPAMNFIAIFTLFLLASVVNAIAVVSP